MGESQGLGLGPGRRLGAFVLREMIGEGGFGAVYLADQEVLQREAVIKISRPANAAGTSDVDRTDQFLREARLASRVDHPFAAHVYDFGAEGDGTLWIAMELVRGTSLADMLKAGPLKRERAIPLLNRLCEVIHTLHEQGIVHRDIKPHNVMVISRAGNMFPKLLDLGIASDIAKSIAAAGQAQTGAISSGMAGTPMYMAPEQWVPGAPISPATDVYAIGVLAYEVLTGKTPFSGNSVMELAMQHARKAPPPLPADFGADLSDVLQKAMAKRPKERYATALALGEALRDASGLAVDAVDLPSIDPQLRDEMLVAAPQPLAECIAMLDAARTPASLRQAMWQTTYTLASYVGNIALAARQRATGRHGDAPEVQALLTKLATTSLDTGEWWRLSRELLRPFADAPALYPVPELVETFFAGGNALKTAMDTLLASQGDDPGAKGAADAIRTFLVGGMLLLGKLLGSLRFLSQYPIAVVNDGQATYWMGLRRSTSVARAWDVSDGGAERGVLLLDGNDQLVCDLSSVAACAESSTGAAKELFWLVGAHQDKAKCQALPGNLELRREDVWEIHLGVNFEERRRSAQGSAGAEASEAQPPYLGLATFGTDDVDRYFGREGEVVGFVNRMQGRRLIAVVGPSGSGKSSFVQAGVLPNLPHKHLYTVMRPGSTPLDALAFAAERLGIATTATELAKAPASLADAIGRQAAAAATPVPLLLVVDQFEELVTMCLDQTAQAHFAEAILAVANHQAIEARVILTLRDDFLIRVAQVPGLRERLSASLHLLTTPLEDDLRRILTEPARRVGYAFEDQALVKEIAQEVASQSAALALLSFTAFQLWQFRDKHYKKLTRKAYQTLGGVGGALAHHAESVMSSLDPEEQKNVREIFRHLVTADGTRASLSRDEILQVAGGEAAGKVLERLIGARLLVAQEGPDGSERIEVIHEALLGAWPRLVQWRHEDAEGARLRDQLRVAAKQWADRNRDRGLLWRGDTLTEYRLWRARYPGAITALEEAFAAASVRDAQRTQRLRRGIAAVLVVALLITTIVFGKLRQEAVASEARAAKQLTESYVEQGRRALLGNDSPSALLFLHRALRRGSPDSALPFMLARAIRPMLAEIGTVGGHRGGIWSLELSPDRTRFLTSSEDGTARVVDLKTRALISELRIHDYTVNGALFATWIDDERILCSGADGMLRMFDARTGKQTATHTAHEGQRIVDFYFQRSTGDVITAAANGQVKRWNVATDKTEVMIDESQKKGTFWFSSNGNALAILMWDGAASGGPAWLVDPAGGLRSLKDRRTPNMLPSTTGAMAAVVAGDGKTIDVIDVNSGRSLATLTGHDQSVTALAFNPDVSMVASGSADQSIRVTDLASKKTHILRSHTANISKLMFIDKHLLVSMSLDGTAKLWDVERELLMLTLSQGGNMWNFFYDPSDRLLATASKIGTVKLWRLDPALLPAFSGNGADNTTDYLEPAVTDGNDQVYYADDGGISRWDLEKGTHLRFETGADAPGQIGLLADKQTLVSFDGAGKLRLLRAGDLTEIKLIATDIAKMMVSPRGTGFVAVDQANALRWYAPDGALLGSASLATEVYQLVWSTNGQTVAALGDGKLWAFDATTRRLHCELTGDFNGSRVSPDGQLLFTSGLRSEEMWDLTGARIKVLDHPSVVISDEFSPGGERFYVGLGDGSILVWDLPSGNRRATLQGAGAAINTIATNDQFVFGKTSRDEVLVWDAAQLRLVARYSITKNSLWGGPDPLGRWLMSVDRSGTLTTQDIRPLPVAQQRDQTLETLIADRIDPEMRARAGL